MTYQPSLGHWRCFVVDVKGWDEFQLTLAEPLIAAACAACGPAPLCPALPLSSLVMPPLPFLVLSHGWVFVTEGFSVVLKVLVFFQEGLNGGVLLGMFHVEMSVYEPEVDCSKGEKCVDVMGFCVLQLRCWCRLKFLRMWALPLAWQALVGLGMPSLVWWSGVPSVFSPCLCALR